MSILKDCPFCAQPQNTLTAHGLGNYSVRCTVCGATQDQKRGKDRAVEDWNLRAPGEVKFDPLVKELRDQLAYHEREIARLSTNSARTAGSQRVSSHKTLGEQYSLVSQAGGRSMNERPTFYAVIPAAVRYADITAQAKLLYGELTALTEQEGFCWASNAYFARLYQAGTRSVSRWLSELEKAGFINIEPAVNQHGQRKIFLADCARPNTAGQKWQAKNGAHNDTSKRTIQEEDTPQPPKGECAVFEKFYETYPRKVDRAQCLSIWKRKRLEGDTGYFILDCLARWKACEQWQNPRYISHPYTFLNQERWKDEPPAPEPTKLKPGEVRVRETTDEEKREAEERIKFLTLMHDNPGKSPDEIAAMMAH